MSFSLDSSRVARFLRVERPAPRRSAASSLERALLFAAAGVAMEILFTGACDFASTGDVRLTGHSYVWMFPIYAIVPFYFDVVRPRVSRLALAPRLAIYVCSVLAVEYATGLLIRLAVGECPWERSYYRSPFAIHGLTRLDYAPAWAVACFLFERLDDLVARLPAAAPLARPPVEELARALEPVRLEAVRGDEGCVEQVCVEQVCVEAVRVEEIRNR